MILQALTQLFEDLAAQGKLSPPGWSNAKISYALCLDYKGSLIAVMPTQHEEQIGKKAQARPNLVLLPSSVTRTAGVLPNFLWDNSSYLLGMDDKGNPSRSNACFAACRNLHHELLDHVNSPTAKAILRYFDTWVPENARENPALADCLQDILKGCNLTFQVNGRFAREDSDIQAAWTAHYGNVTGEKQQCLVTGKPDIPEAVHPLIKGVSGAQSSGAAIVSFNAPALCSYGKEQSLNAPVGKYAAFAYTAALNYLLSDKPNVHRIGDCTIVCWADGAQEQYTDFASISLFGDNLPETWSSEDLYDAMHKLAQGLPCQELSLDPNRSFYVLGLSPNAARLSVRFFFRDSFGSMIRNVNNHYQRLEIQGNNYPIIPLWALLRETVNKNATDKSPSPVMAGAAARAIFTGSPYPASLLESTMLRIRADHEITSGRAAILKAYYLRNPSIQCPKEVLTVSLNENSTNIPYTLGRLFAVYEVLQERANPGINATIKDKYFNAASATPAVIFPILGNLSQKHLRKLDVGQQIYFEKQIGNLKSKLPESYPNQLSLQEQGSFDLGYYHQKQSRFEKKEEK